MTGSPRDTPLHLASVSNQSGIGDVSDYGWREPEFDDAALARFASLVSGWRLEHEPGTWFAYSNAGYELLGHLLATVGGQSFEAVFKLRVLDAAGMATSTFLGTDTVWGVIELHRPGLAAARALAAGPTGFLRGLAHDGIGPRDRRSSRGCRCDSSSLRSKETVSVGRSSVSAW